MKQNNFQENAMLFSYNTVPFAAVEPQPNQVNLICSAHGFSLLCFELYSPTRGAMITYYVKLPEQEAHVVLDRGLPTVKDFKKTDIINLFEGTSNDVPEERKEAINNLFNNKSKLLFYI